MCVFFVSCVCISIDSSGFFSLFDTGLQLFDDHIHTGGKAYEIFNRQFLLLLLLQV